MDSRLILRLDKETRERITRIARRRQISVSEVIREAIGSWVERHDTDACYENAADLIGVAHGGDSKRSTATGRSLRPLLKGHEGVLIVDAGDAPRLIDADHQFHEQDA